MTRRMYRWLALLTGVDPDAPRRYIKVAWNREARISEREALELRFWASELPDHPGRPIRDVGVQSVMRLDKCGGERLGVFASDAGEPAWMATLDEGGGTKLVARQAFSEWESQQSSGLRELWSVLRGLLSFSSFRDATLVVLNDNQTAVQALEIGSRTPEMNDVAIAIFLVAMRRNVQIVARWLGRASAEVQENDDGSKIVDRADFMLDPDVFRLIQRRFGLRYSFDRFSSRDTTQGAPALPFNSLWGCPEAAGRPDAFTHDWSGHVNWLHPPRCDIGRAIRHLRDCEAEGTIVVPLTPRADWWPFVRAGAASVAFRRGRPARHVIVRRHGLLRGDGGTRPLDRGRFHLLAAHLDFTTSSGRGRVAPALRAEVIRRVAGSG